MPAAAPRTAARKQDRVNAVRGYKSRESADKSALWPVACCTHHGRLHGVNGMTPRLIWLLFASLALVRASSADQAFERAKILREYNASVAACTDGADGVIVELIPLANRTAGRRLDGGPTPAERYLERLAERHAHLTERRSLSSLLMVHGTYSQLIDGFSAALDEAMLAFVLNDTAEVLAVSANWSVLRAPASPLACRLHAHAKSSRLLTPPPPLSSPLRPPPPPRSILLVDDPAIESSSSTTPASITAHSTQSAPPWGLDRIDSRSGRDQSFNYGTATGAAHLA